MHIATAVLLGLALAALKLAYSFLPGFNVIDAVVFLAVGYWAARRAASWKTLAVLCAPTVMMALHFAGNLDRAELMARGVGGGWVLSAVLVPAAAALGMLAARRGARTGGVAG